MINKIVLMIVFVFCYGLCEAATLREVTIEEDGNGDYTTLAAAETGEDGDIVTSDEYVEFKICGTDLTGNGWDNPDTTAVLVDGWTTSASCYIKIYTTASARHDGAWDTSAYRLIPTSGSTALWLREDYVRLEGLQIQNNRATSTAIVLYFDSTDGAAQVDNVFIRSGTGSGAHYGIGIQGGTGEVNISNTVVEGIGSGTVYYGIYDYSPLEYNAYNCTVSGWNICYHEAIILKNNIADDCTTNYSGSPHSTSTHNTTDDTPSAVIAFGATHESGKLTDGDEASKLIDSGETFPNVVVGNIVHNTTDSTYTYITSIAEVASGKIGINDDIFDATEGYTVYTNHYGDVTFVDEVNGDFHLDSGDTIALDKGTNLSSDPNYAFNIDIDGDTRSDPWDIGVDETTPATTTVPPSGAVRTHIGIIRR